MREIINLGKVNKQTEVEMKIEFTNKEQYFLNKAANGLVKYPYETYLNIILRMLDQKSDRSKYLVTSSFLQLSEGIRRKIVEWQFDREIEKALINPNYGTDAKALANLNTRKESYETTLKNLTPLHSNILKTLDQESDLTRREISLRTGISLQSVCARVRELVKDGYVQVTGTSYDSDTERKVQTLGRV